MTNWRDLGKAGRIEAIRSAWAPGISSRRLAAALHVSRTAVIGMYHRYPDQLASTPLQGGHGGRHGKGREWTREEHALVAQMMRDHKSADVVAQVIGGDATGDKVIALVRRTPELRAIGWSARSNRARLTQEERKARQLETGRRFRAKQRAAPAVAVPHHERKPFKPVVVSTNTALMVADWIAANGVRRFERGDSSEYFRVSAYLEERGWQVSMYGGRYTMAGPNGRKREVKWKDVLVVADRFRMAEGLEPFLAA